MGFVLVPVLVLHSWAWSVYRMCMASVCEHTRCMAFLDCTSVCTGYIAGKTSSTHVSGMIDSAYGQREDVADRHLFY